LSPGSHIEHHVPWRSGPGDWRLGRCRYRDGRERLSSRFGIPGAERRTSSEKCSFSIIGRCRETGGTGIVFFVADRRSLVPSRIPTASAGRTDVPSACLDENAGRDVLVDSGDYLGSCADDAANPRAIASGTRESHYSFNSSPISAGIALLPASSRGGYRGERCIPGVDATTRVPPGKPVHASPLRRLGSLYADGAARHRDRAGDYAPEQAGPHPARISGSVERVRL